MTQALIIGYGNPLRGDDGLGWHAAQQLAAVLREAKAHIIACHQLTPELAEAVSRADLAVFIDATADGPAGTLSCRQARPEIWLPDAFSHHLTPGRLLACVQALYGTCPEAHLLSIAGTFFGYGEQLSPTVQAALPCLVEHVQRLVAG